MAIRTIKHPSGQVTYQIDYYDPNGKRRRRNFKRKKDAVAEHSKRVSLIAEGRYLDVKKESRYTLGELLTRYHKTYERQTAFVTQKSHAIQSFARHCGCKIQRAGGETTYLAGPLLSKIGLYQLEQYRNARLATPKERGGGERSKASVNRELSAVRHVFSKAVEWGMMEKSPFTGSKKFFYNETSGRLRFLDEDEARRLLAECPVHLHPVVFTALHTGMRRGEILGLKWDDIRGGYIYLTKTKNGEGRQIPVSDDLTNLFKGLRRRNGLKSSYVFLGHKGQPIREIRKSFASACRRAGIEKFRFHDLRHTFASWLVMKGVDLRTVQELLGHRTLTMTMRYAHLSNAHKKEAVNLINMEKENACGTRSFRVG